VTDRRETAKWLVENGLRAQLRTGSLLTGQLYVALDFFPNASKATMDWEKNPPELPTVPGNLQSLQDKINTLVTKLDKIPFEGIGKDLRQTLQSADALVKSLDTKVAPEARAALVAARTALESANGTLSSGSAVAQSTVDTMRELSRTAASFRVLADYLERHPEALIRGKPEDQK
jgi:paraquat-inducible protein B